MAKINKSKGIKSEKSKSKKYSANEIFVKVMAGLLALLMLIAAGATLMYCLLH